MPRHIVSILPIFVVAFFALTGCPSTSTSRDGDIAAREPKPISYSDWETSPLAEKIKDLIMKNPDYSHRASGDCGNPMMAMTGAFESIVSGAPTEYIIPLLNHQAPYLRAAVNNVLHASIEKSKPVIEDAFSKGNDRIKLELLHYVEPDATYERKIELLTKIIADPRQPVFYEDTYYLQGPEAYTNFKTIKDYPVEIFTFYVRLLREAGWEGDRDASVEALGKFGAEASGAVPDITKLMNESRKSTRQDYGDKPVIVESVDIVAIKALGDIGPSASTAIPDLVQFYNDKSLEHNQARFTVASSLYLIGHKKSEMVDYLVDELNNPWRVNGQFTLSDDGVYPPILGNLQRIGLDAKAALPKLKELAYNQAVDKRLVREGTINTIAAIEGDYKSVVPIYIEMLNATPYLRDEAISSLYSIRDTTDISPTLPLLLKAMYKEGEAKYTLIQLLLTFPGHDDEIVDGTIYLYQQNIEQRENLLNIVSRKLGDHAKAMLPIAKEMIIGSDGSDLTTGVTVYLAAGGSKQWVFDTLVNMTYSPDETRVRNAIHGFRYLKDYRTKSFNRLDELAQSESNGISKWAERMLSTIKDDLKMEAAMKQ